MADIKNFLQGLVREILYGQHKSNHGMMESISEKLITDVYLEIVKKRISEFAVLDSGGY